VAGAGHRREIGDISRLGVSVGVEEESEREERGERGERGKKGDETRLGEERTVSSGD
jgi:hypothetical protein